MTGWSDIMLFEFQVGDRVETISHCIGTVVGIDHDEVGVFIVIQFDTLPGEFAYDPKDLALIHNAFSDKGGIENE
ncbi:hypothetical protein DP73_13065 [Desulfosporosinus sp. HMP52]|nr:hypothetical protein [Desulfosporosinus sp. HMP52]KGK88221.1 hypothetical protein DP73_13065 [Desulfosporosinus sp. HMP52]